MATKDISDLQVCRAYAEMLRRRDASEVGVYVDDLLTSMTGQPPKVCERAMERAVRRDLVDYGTWLRGGWLTEQGRALVASITAPTTRTPSRRSIGPPGPQESPAEPSKTGPGGGKSLGVAGL